MNAAVAPLTNDAMVQVIVPVPFAGGVAQLNAGPLVCESDAKVVFGGNTSVREVLAASLGPLL